MPCCQAQQDSSHRLTAILIMKLGQELIIKTPLLGEPSWAFARIRAACISRVIAFRNIVGTATLGQRLRKKGY